MGTEKVSIPATLRKTESKRHIAGPAPVNERIRVTLVLRHRSPAVAASAMDLGNTPILKRRYFKDDQLDLHFGASEKDVAIVNKFARENKLRILKAGAGSRTILLEGTVGQFNRAFDIELRSFKEKKHPAGYRSHEKQVMIPKEL